MENFNGQNLIRNGPELLTRVYRKTCNATSNSEEVPWTCGNFTILKQHKCYEIGWPEWDKLFKASKSRETMNRIKDSYFVHFWNDKGFKVNLSKTKDLGVPYIRLARTYCPKVMDVPDDEF